MKFVLTIFFFLCLLSSIALETTDPKVLITENFEQAPLKDVLVTLKEKYDLRLAYSDKLVRDVVITANLQNVAIPEALELIFHSVSLLTYEYIEPRAVIIKKGIRSPTTFNLNGEIVDMETGERLPFVYMFLEPLNRSISSNEEGHFSMNNLTENAVLKISYLGYKDTTIYLSEYDKRSRLIIPLSSQSSSLKEVIVSDGQNETFQSGESMGAITINSKFASEMPQSGEPDVFRTIHLLPGVSATNELSSGLFVNGGTSTQNLVIFDGIPIYHVDHFFGYFSAINPYAVKSTRLFKGGFDAKYGGRSSSLVEFVGKDGNTEKVSGKISFNLLSVNTSVEVPVNDNTTLFFSARRSYTDVFQTSLFEDIFSIYETTNFNDTPSEITITDFGVEPEFYYTDLNFKISSLIGVKNRVSFSFYDSNDILNYDEKLTGLLPADTAIAYSNLGFINWGNVGTSLKWSTLWNTQHFTHFLASYSYYQSDFKESNTAFVSKNNFSQTSIADLDQSNFIKDLSLKIDHEWTVGLNRFEFGIGLSQYHTQISSLQNDSVITYKDQPGSMVFTQYVQNHYELSNKTQFSVGLRGNYLSNTGEYLFEPRVGVIHQISPSWSASISSGIFRQFVNQVNTTNALQGSRDLWVMADNDIPSQKAVHFMTGITRSKRNSVIQVNGFYKRFDGLLDYAFKQGGLITEYQDYEELFFEGQGVARGLEFMFKHSIGRFTGWTSYTLSETNYRYEQLNLGNYYPADHDQRHELNVFGSFQWGKLTMFSTWYYGSGRPYSTLVLPQTSQENPRVASKQVITLFRDQKNDQRYPAYHRLDFGANYELQIGNNQLKFTGKIFNVYNRRNVYDRNVELRALPMQGIDFQNPNSSKGRVTEVVVDTRLMGFTPSLSMEFSF